jgi:uncharacterized RDD family membrane protein YckC
VNDPVSDIAAGWFKDPVDRSVQRYWDGEGWIGDPIPADATPPDGPPPVEEAPVEPTPVGPTPGGATPAGATPAVGVPLGGSSPGWPPPQAGPTGPPPAGWQPPPQGWQAPPQGWQAPPQGWQPPQAWQPPPGWVPPPGWAPPPGWQPPPGWTPQAGPHGYAYRQEVRPHGMSLAGFGPRLMARILDFIAVLLLNVLVNGWFAYQLVVEMAPAFRAAMQNPMATPEPASSRAQYLVLTMLFVATALWLAYEVPAIGNTGQTLGKRIMHIRVVRLESTEPIGFGRAFRRWGRLGLWTPLWGCWGVGLLFQLIDSLSPVFDQKLRQALHDKTAHTVVVDAPPNAPGSPAAGRPAAGPASADARGGSTADGGVPDDGPDPTGGAR